MFEFIKYFMFLSVAISSAAYGNSKINLNELPFNSEVVKLISFEKSILSNIPYSQLKKIGTPVGLNTLLFWKKAQSNFKYSDTYIAKMVTPTGGEEWRCLSEALYFEARGESIMGQFAVAEVILNRVDSKSFPKTICKVVAQGTKKGRKHNCQFSYNCDGLTERITEKSAFKVSQKVAKIMMNNEPRAITYGALYYHAKFVRPKWSRRLKRTATIGLHHFYADNR
jgi:spore germination cell wall hydrolase CwlJ-like protein